MVAGAGVVLMSRQSGSSSGILGDAGVEQKQKAQQKSLAAISDDGELGLMQLMVRG